MTSSLHGPPGLIELHDFAGKLGLRRDWFQPHPSHPHYDLTARKRDAAMRLGAWFLPAREQALGRMLILEDKETE